MTKPRIKAAPPPADLDEENEVSDFLDYEALTPRLTEIRQKLGLSDDADIEAKAHVWKLNADGEGTDYKVFEGLPEQYDLRKLAQQFGSGRYKLAVYARNETGNMPRYINSVVAWMLTPDEEARYLAKRASAQNPQINQPVQNNNDMAMLVAAMTGGFQKLGELIVAANARPATNPLDEMAKLAGVMRTLMPPAPTPVAAADDFTATMTKFKLFQDVTGGGRSSADQDPSTALMMEGIRAFAPVLQAGVAAQRQTQAPPEMVQSVHVAPPQLPAPQPSPPENDEMIMFKMQLALAVKAAAAARDPVDFAESVYQLIPNDVMLSMALDADWFALLVRANAKVDAHRAWFEAVRNAMMEFAVEDKILIRAADGRLTLFELGGITAEPSADPVPDNAAGTTSPDAEHVIHDPGRKTGNAGDAESDAARRD